MFGNKSKTLFVDLAGDSVFAAATSSPKAPMTIECLREIRLSDGEELAASLREMAGVRGNGLVAAACSVYPTGRIVVATNVDPKRFSEGNYLNETIHEAAKIDAANYSLHMLSPEDGSDIARVKGPSRIALVCGAPTDELIRRQDDLLQNGCYPTRFEIGTVSTLGGLMDYLKFSQSKAPTLLLEIGKEATGVFIVTAERVEISRSVQFGINSMIPQVQKELGLKDEEAARKLFFSNSFDFTGLGAQLTKRLVRELQASIGFYEVQTGLSVSQLCCTLIPSKVQWLDKTLADVLGMRVLNADYSGWLKMHEVEFAQECANVARGAGWMGLFSLIGQYRDKKDEAAA